MDIFEEVKRLNLPFGEYLILGSGPLAARGIRGYKDIDILVTGNLYKKLIEQGWKTVEINGVNGKLEVLKNGKFEIDKRLWCRKYKPDTSDLIKGAEIINGIPFMPLKELIKFKTALGREKDLKDIELIEEYLRKVENIGLQKEEVKLLPYDPAWVEIYKKEEELLHSALGSIAPEIQHIGSTSIPGAVAKPIIDIAVGINDLKDAGKYIEPLKKLGYKLEHGAEDGRYFFTKESNGKITHHLHIEKLGSDVWNRQIIFINYLKKNKEVLDKYNKFKSQLAEKYKNNRKAYVVAKIKFIDDLINEAKIQK